MATTKKLTALGMDVFAGLIMRGVIDAGFEVVAHLEHGDYGVPTARRNFPGLDVRARKKDWNTQDFKGKVDFVVTNPPCALWSTMRANTNDEGGHWSQGTERLGYIQDCVSVGIAVAPKAWCWESVAGAWGRGYSFVLEQAYRWVAAGWSCTVLLEDAQRLGVPQRRHRMFLIAHRHPLVWPALVRPTTVRQVLEALPARLRTERLDGDCGHTLGGKGLKRHWATCLPTPPVTPKPLTPFWQRLWKDAPSFGGHLAGSYEELTDNERKAFKSKELTGVFKPLGATLRVDAERAAPVMLSGATRFHPWEPRLFNWYEWLALCGLPLSWQTSQTRYEPATVELARAVMPGVGRWLATAVKDGFSLPQLQAPSIRLVDLRYEGRELDQELWRYGQPRLTTAEGPVTRRSAGKTFLAALGQAQRGEADEAAAQAAIKRLCF